jgi:hypothetical protein
MKKIGSLFLMLLPFAAFCSNDSLITGRDSIQVKKIAMELSCSPDFCFRTLKANDAGKEIADYRDTLEIPKFGYTAGLSVLFKINPKIGIETGILFSDSGEKTKKHALENVPYGQEAIRYSFNYHYYYLKVPVKVNYNLLSGKLKFYVTAGVSADIFLGQKTTSITTYANSSERRSSKADPGFSKLNFAVLAGCGMSYPVGKRMDLKIEPVYRRSITSIINAPVKGYLYSAGLNIGFCYNL